MNREDFDKSIVHLTNSGFSINDETADAYFRVLKNIDYDEFQDVVTKIIQEEKTLPKVPHIFAILNSVRETREGSKFTESQWADFYCKDCDLPLAIPLYKLIGDGCIQCSTCYGYYAKRKSWSKGYLRERWEMTKFHDGKSSTYIKSTVEPESWII